MALRHTVKLKKYQDINIEKVAAAAITPGHLVELTSANKVQAHSGDGVGAFPKMFALEDELQGKEIDDAYAADDPVQVWVCQPGEVVYALLKNGETAVVGSPLDSAGDGTLAVTTTASAVIVGIALEALDLSGSSGEETTYRIPVMIV